MFSPFEVQLGIMRKNGPKLFSMQTSVDISATQYVYVVDITSELLLLHIILIMVVHF